MIWTFRRNSRRAVSIVDNMAGEVGCPRAGPIFVCGLLIFWMYGLASLTDTDPRDPRYWPEVFGKMFAFHYGGSVAIPASLGLVLGIALLLSGILKTRQ